MCGVGPQASLVVPTTYSIRLRLNERFSAGDAVAAASKNQINDLG